MHPLFRKADDLSRQVIGAAIEVHRLKGPGLIESIYERCLMRELELRGIGTINQRLIRIEYKGLVFDEPLRFDVLAEGCLLLELKCVQAVLPIHQAQLLSYMKLLDIPLGLIINFHELKLTDGVVRMILPGANRDGEEINRRQRRQRRRERHRLYELMCCRPENAVCKQFLKICVMQTLNDRLLLFALRAGVLLLDWRQIEP